MQIELSFHALKLKNVAGALKGTSDPYAVITQLATVPGTKPRVLGKTEVVQNTLSPQWVKVFVLPDYTLGNVQKIAVSVFDEVKKGDHKSMGSAVFDVDELLGARGNTKAKKLKQGGTIFAMARKAQGSGVLRLSLKGTKLKNVEGLFSKSDPFFELSRNINSAGGLTWDNVFRSEAKKNNLEPVWETAVIDLSTLCGGDLDSPVRISVFDHESSGNHISMGTTDVSVNGMQSAAASGTAIKLKKKGKEVGTLFVTQASVEGIAAASDITGRMAATSISSPQQPSIVGRKADFVDYVSGGCQLNVVVAIDFTGSNGDPRKPGTLHHIHPQMMNDYEKAISSIVQILAKYDSDQNFPVVGFGAKYGGVVRHCFQCGPTDQVHGVKGVLDAYDGVFRSGLIMSGPTVFTEVMEMAAGRAKSAAAEAQQRGEQAYTILLVLTDGAVSDPAATAGCLEHISDAPLSVVIVGVGNADFSSMQFLDDAGKKRDIVQFVQFNRHSQSSVALTSETLRELPDQLVGYFQKNGIQPLPPVQRSDSNIVVEEEEEIDLSLDIGEEEIVVSGGGNGFVDGFAR